MPAKKQIDHAPVVRRFADRLRERRLALGLTQAELARRAAVTVNYVGRLEAAGAAPGIDLLDRLAAALGTAAADLLPADAPPDPSAALRREARRLFAPLVETADPDTLRVLVPLLARLAARPPADR